MPTYEYRCKGCGHELEIVQAFTDDALTTCPACRTDQLKKVFGAVGISFKGSGFYKTDSRSGAAASTGSSADGGSSSSGSSSTSSSSTSSSSSSTSSSSDSSTSSSTTAAPA